MAEQTEPGEQLRPWERYLDAAYRLPGDDDLPTIVVVNGRVQFGGTHIDPSQTREFSARLAEASALADGSLVLP